MNETLAHYLADYIEQELDEFTQGFPDIEIAEIDASLLEGWIVQGIDAYKSIGGRK